MYASAAVKYTLRRKGELNAYWNFVNWKLGLFGFNNWESAKGFICDLGRLDRHRIHA